MERPSLAGLLKGNFIIAHRHRSPCFAFVCGLAKGERPVPKFTPFEGLTRRPVRIRISQVLRVALCLICGLGGLAAQEGPFRVQTKVVQVPVTVTDKKGINVDGLAAEDFRLLDNGVRQEVSVDDFVSGGAPISLVIAVQTSGISTPALATIRRIGGLIQPLLSGAQGEVAVASFDRGIHWLQDFTPDDRKIRAAVENLNVGLTLNDARMLDAVAVVARHMEPRPGRKMLVLIAESRDRGSETSLQQALEAVERQGIQVFGVHYSAYATSLMAKPKDAPDLSSPPEFPDDVTEAPNPAPNVNIGSIFSELARRGKANTIQVLARASGGSDHPFVKERGLEDAIEKLGAEVHSQYVLNFAQPKDAEGWHKIMVSVPGHGDFSIRARTSYWADLINVP
jgi:VWFA-related protein